MRLRHASRDAALDHADGVARLNGAAIIIPDDEEKAFTEMDLLRTALAEEKPPTAVIITGCNEDRYRTEDAIAAAIRKELKRAKRRAA